MDSTKNNLSCGTCKHSGKAGNAYPCVMCNSHGSEWQHPNDPLPARHVREADKKLQQYKEYKEAAPSLSQQRLVVPANEKATDKQVGGDHYKMKIQPIVFIVENEIPYREANAIKYICRHKKKNGKQDIEKAIHYLQMVLEEYDQ